MQREAEKTKSNLNRYRMQRVHKSSGLVNIGGMMPNVNGIEIDGSGANSSMAGSVHH